jgi:hypothetical protein
LHLLLSKTGILSFVRFVIPLDVSFFFLLFVPHCGWVSMHGKSSSE